MTVGLAPGLFERERELGQLDAALSAAQAGVGQIVVVQGPPGIGKSRLVDALCARAVGSARVLRGRGGELERELPLAVVRELFEPVVGRADVAERSRLLAGAAGLAGPLLGVGVGESGAVDSAFAVMHGLYWLTANLADDGSLVLAVDDAHWTDEATQRWLAYLVPRIAELPVLLVLALRPRELDPASRLAAALAVCAEVTLVEPGELGVAGTRGLVAHALGEPDPEFCAAVHRATGGNPLLVRTLAGALAARGIAPSAATVDQVHSVGIGRIGRIVLPRMHQLGRDAVAFARAAAVLGDGPRPTDVRALAGLTEAAARAAADALVRTEVLRSDGSLGFVHPLVRAAVADELSPSARSDLHRRAAEQLAAHDANPPETAGHLLATEPVGEEWAMATLRRAAALAISQGSPEAAIAFLDRALLEEPPRERRAEILLELGSAAYHIHHPRAVEWLSEAVRHAEKPQTWVRCWLTWGEAAVFSGERVPLAATLSGAPALEGDLAYPLAARLLTNYGFAGSRVRSLGRLSRPVAEPPGETEFERVWLAAASLDAVMECTAATEAARLASRAFSSGTFVAEACESWSYTCATLGLISSGELSRGLHASQLAVEYTSRRGSRMHLGWCRGHQALARLRLGDVVDAEADIVVAVDDVSGQGSVIGLPVLLATLVEVLRERGKLDSAEAALAHNGLLEGAPPPHVWGARLLEARGRLHLACGRIDAALADLRACGDLLARVGVPHSAMFRWRSLAALCLAALGAHGEAVRLAEEQVTDARRFGAAPWLGSSLRALGTVTGGQDGIALAREAVDVLAASEARLEYAHALCELGVLLRHERRPREAREPLRQALHLAERCGAHALADRAAEELAAAGARPRRRAITGADSLTASERRVVMLAAQGKSNPEIAQSLFVTRKTVEKHLGNAFLKLQITSRAELAAALNAQG